MGTCNTKFYLLATLALMSTCVDHVVPELLPASAVQARAAGIVPRQALFKSAPVAISPADRFQNQFHIPYAEIRARPVLQFGFGIQPHARPPTTCKQEHREWNSILNVSLNVLTQRAPGAHPRIAAGISQPVVASSATSNSRLTESVQHSSAIQLLRSQPGMHARTDCAPGIQPNSRKSDVGPDRDSPKTKHACKCSLLEEITVRPPEGRCGSSSF